MPPPPPIDVTAIATDQRAEVAEATLAYGRRGERGSPVLLLIGYAAPGRAWVHQVAPLARQHRVAWLDNRGSGATEAAPGRYSAALLADDAAALLDHLGWERTHVVGVSMGGMVAQELALRRRSRLRSLTLIASHAGGLLARLPPGPGWLLRTIVGSRAARLRALERLLFPAEFSARCDRAWMAAMLKADYGAPPPPGGRRAQLAVLAGHDTRGRLRQLVGLPTLVVRAGRDLLVRPQESGALARRIPGARLLELPDAGHGVIRQCYPRLNAALLDHVAAADARAAADR
jgi:3-oxoadipate enol-lactonase